MPRGARPRAFRLRVIRELLKRKTAAKQQTFDFLEEHPIIRLSHAYYAMCT